MPPTQRILNAAVSCSAEGSPASMGVPTLTSGTEDSVAIASDESPSSDSGASCETLPDQPCLGMVPILCPDCAIACEPDVKRDPSDERRSKLEVRKCLLMNCLSSRGRCPRSYTLGEML